MRKTWKRIVSVMMALAMVVLCLPGYSNPVKTAKAAAAGVSYIDASGETQTYTGTYRSIRGGGNANTNRPTTWTSGWYVVEPYNNSGSGNEISIGSRVTLSANSTVNLILKDGVKLKVTSGITVPKGCTLNIYAQSTGSDMGQLYTGSNNVARNNAGIGGTGSGAGAITINGGKITAYGGSNSAGIGGGRYDNGGAVTINGGAVNAYGGSSGGAGIGGGRHGNGGTITINGGVVNAYGGSEYGAGIGGGYHGYGGTISISGNNTVVNATGGSYAAGIGGGCSYDEDTVVSQHITISGGKITAIGGTGAAGIGSGESQTVGTISISGGTVNATAGGYDTYVMTEYFTAAIGGTFGSADKITISGGSITTHLPSENDRYCTGIGSIYGSDNANVEITGGVVVANGTTGRYAGIGIGTGVSALGGKVSISITDNNASVTANSYGGTVTLVTPVTDVTSDPNVNLPAGVVSNHNQINGKKLVKGTSYTIQFVNADTDHTPLQDPIEVTPGTHPKYSGTTPTLPTTAQYTYTFSGWEDENHQTYGKDEELPAANGSMTYTATYTATVNEYTVTFVTENGSEISSETYPYNTAADNIAVPTAPEKDPSTEETFEFKGWLNTTTNAIGVVAVTGDVTYKATYAGSPRKYTVTFVDENGVNIIDPVEYEYNTAANAITVPEAPTKDPSTEETFAFTGWKNTTTNEIGVVAVTGDATYKATYTGSPRKYTVTFKDANGNNIIDPAQYDYNTPADNIVIPEAPFKDADANYVYTFSGWSPAITAVTGDATYVATYSASPRQYSDLEVKVVWDDNGNCDGFRPDSVTVTLLGNEETVSTQDLSGDAWTYTFHVPTNDVKGHPITYTIDANSVDSYEKTVNSFTVTYKHTPETTEASVKVVWVDSNDAFSTRPNDLEVYLSDGEVVTLTANSWAATLSDLLKRQDGQIINYTWREFSVPGYKLTNTTTEGTTTTFTFTMITTTVSGEVLWELKDNSVDLLPENVTVYIKDGDTTVDTITVTANTVGEWTFTSIALPKCRTDGTGTIEIPYTVSEAAVPRFATTISGTEITNTLNTCDVTVSISWDDADNQDGYRPNEDGVAVTLIGDSVEVDTIVLNAENGWTHTWTDVPKEADSDTDIQYTVEGATVSEYDLTLDDDDPYIKVLNYQHTPETTEVNIEVVWNDKDNQDGYRPDAITVNLLADNEIVENAELLAFDQSNSWLNLPKKANGENIDYTVTVEEDNLSEYSVAIDKAEGDNFKYTVTLNHEIEKTNVKVSKIWDDADNQDGYRPDYVTIRLLAGSVEKDEVTLNEDNNWTYTWSDLDKKAGGVAIDYTVKEDGVENYNAQITKAEDGTFTYTVTNTHEPEETEVKVSKVWSDADDQDGYRPDEVTINLLVNGSPEEYVTLNEDNNWTYTWTKLPKKADGSDIDYTVTENDVAEYSTNIVKAEDGTFTYTVTNTHETEETEVSVTKVWDDADNQDGYRPDEVTINLLADGEVIDTVKLSEENGWYYHWTKLDKKAAGVEIDYTVSEDTVANYTPYIEQDEDGSFTYTVTNKHTTEKVDVTVSKVWEDSNDLEGFRPESVTVHLYIGSEMIDTAVLGSNNEWAFTFEGLEKNANGSAINYKVTEDPVANYSTEITKATDGTFTYTITNRREVEKTEASAAIVWDDANNNDGIRPENVTVTLMNDDKVVGSETLNASNSWTVTWPNLQKYSEGEEIVYTVSVDDIDDYTTEIVKSEDSLSYTITNKHNLFETEATINVVWNLDAKEDKNPPASLTVRLSDGTEVELNANNNWTYTVDHLLKYDAGTEVVYTWTADNLPGGFVLSGTAKENTTTTFSLTYTPDPTEKALGVKKILTGRSMIVGDAFTFVLEADSGNPEGATLPDETTVVATEEETSVTFDNIVFTKYGTYKFYIREVDDGVAGITYDTEEKEITVVVKDDGEGALYVDSVTNDGKVIVTNEYHSSGSITFDAKVVLIGQDLEEGYFNVGVSNSDGTIRSAFCDADGNIVFPAINYDETDMVVDGQIVTSRRYEYTFIEFPADNTEIEHVIYDLTSYTLTVELTDNLDGTITATIVEGDPDTNVVFTNVAVNILNMDENGNALEGSHLRILDSSGSIIDEWDTTGEPRHAHGLVSEKVYTLEQTRIPGGYAFAPVAMFMVNEDGTFTVSGLTIDEDSVLLLQNRLAKTPDFELKTQDVNDSTGETTEWQDTADYDIGDAIPYKLAVSLADNVTDYRTYSITFHDTMEDGLTFAEINKVTVNGEELGTADYMVASNDHGFDLTVSFGNGSAKIDDDTLNEALVEVYFTATLNENAVLGSAGNVNTCTLEYSINPSVDENGTQSDETEATDSDAAVVFTYGIEISVVDEDGNAVSDAEFTVFKKMADGNTVERSLTKTGDGQFKVSGVDDGDYILEKDGEPVSVVAIDSVPFSVTADHSPSIEDTALESLTGDADEALAFTADKTTGILSGVLTMEFVKLTVTFVDEKDQVISSKDYKYGTKAEDIEAPEAPEKKADDKYTYIFKGWDPELADVTEEATYKPLFDSKVNEYTITFVNADGTELQSGKVAYGKTPEYTGTTPTKASDGKYDYTFDSWTPAIADVTADATYTAKYKATEIKKDPVKGVYKYIGEAAKYTKGSKKAVTIIFKRTENDEITFDMFAGVKTAKGNLVSGTHYTAKKGSVEITLLPDYLETLEVGKTAITVSFQDGDPVTIELEVAPAQQQADTNPTTGDSLNMNYIWIICVIGAAALAIVLFLQIRRRREEEF
ncbi:MAG: Cna B-type domain-containing protein [Lachnospiraceae bacterium]|nr:Cna B-type domain-containing protein [Lachnospiraceae bacterium]